MQRFNLSLLLDRVAQANPDRIAYRFKGNALSYGQLDRAASQVGEYLVASGINPGDRVAVSLPKCLEIPVAVYGVLQTGAVFVPVDPHASVSRKRQVLEACQASAIIGDESDCTYIAGLMDAVPSLIASVGLTPRGLERSDCVSWDQIRSLDGATFRHVGGDDELAYIMYTSGSTGQPKGIMHSHASGFAYADMSAALYGVAGTDVIGGHAPLHTDMSTFAYLTGPHAGATTVIVPDECGMFPVQLSDLLRDEQVTIWYSVPQLLVGLVDRGRLDDLPDLRWVLYGGEPIATKYLSKLMDVWRSARFANVYGPAEVNQCTHYEVGQQALRMQQVPIGTPCDGMELRVVDPSNPTRAVPRGETGELIVSSPTMMSGYWGAPDKTREAIYEEGDQPDTKRFYRTGDLVRQLSDGLLDFVGRMDRQIKLRGYRVELDGIEAIAAQHPNVIEAAVTALEDRRGQRSGLALFVTLKDSDANAVDGIRRHMKSNVPPYAVPRQITVVDNFPRTGAGKIDRKSLD